MNENMINKDNLRLEAERLNTMINILTLFTRRTAVEWLPDISSITGVKAEQFSVMFELSIEPNQSLKQLSRNLMASAPNVSVMIQSMVEDGVVSRIADPTDRRRVLLRLGDKGEKLFSDVQEHLVERYQGYLRDLCDKDQKDLDHATLLMLMVMERILKRSLVNRDNKGV